jgi:DNA-binding LacI/PurR family transcriptional regulator
MPPRRPKAKDVKPRVPVTVGLQLHSKSRQLAAFLRQAISDGQLITPLPGMRHWSRELGVGRRTLHAALHELQAEGMLTVHARGARLHPDMPAKPALPAVKARRVRWLIENTYRRHLHNYHETFSRLQQRLSSHHIGLHWETCSPARLRAIAHEPAKAGELFLLASLSPPCQELFVRAQKPSVVLGEPAAGIVLPFINADLAGSVRHAVFQLLRQGCGQMRLVHLHSASVGLRHAREAFQNACAEWSRGPVHPLAIATTLDRPALLSAMRRLVNGIKPRTGVIVLAPVPIGMVVTALLQHGLALPAQVEVAALMHPPESVQLAPVLRHYPWPMGALVRQIAAAAENYFSRGTLPATGKTLAIEAASTVD